MPPVATMQGRSILTINDHPAMRKIFSRFPSRTVPIRYTIGGNGRSAPRKERIYVPARA